MVACFSARLDRSWSARSRILRGERETGKATVTLDKDGAPPIAVKNTLIKILLPPCSNPPPRPPARGFRSKSVNTSDRDCSRTHFDVSGILERWKFPPQSLIVLTGLYSVNVLNVA